MWISLVYLLLRRRYSPGWVLASFTIRLQASRSLALSLHSFIPIFLRSVDTSSSHLIFGLPLHLVACSFPYIFFGTAVSCILSIWPSHRILWHFINLTMFSPLIIASNSSFRRILHNSFSFTVPYIFRSIFLSNTADALSSSTVRVHNSEPQVSLVYTVQLYYNARCKHHANAEEYTMWHTGYAYLYIFAWYVHFAGG